MLLRIYVLILFSSILDKSIDACLLVVLFCQMQMQVSQLTNKVRDTRVMTSIKTMQAKHLIDEKSELQSLLQDRDQQLRVIKEKCQVGSNFC